MLVHSTVLIIGCSSAVLCRRAHAEADHTPRLITRVPFVWNNKVTQQRHLRHLNGAEASGEHVCAEEQPLNRKPPAAYTTHRTDC